jgi:outer membrane receptor protein involved in Fe transport
LKSLAVAIVLVAGGSSAFAQPPADTPASELSLDELLRVDVPVVVGASRFAQHVTDAPSSITVITREEIERFGYRTMAEILRSVRGFYVTYDRNYSFLGTRGFGRPTDYNNRVLFLIDGHRHNDKVYDGALLGTEFPIDPDWIERVEIVRGPSSSLYGTSAFSAVVNVITRQGMDATGARATVDIASLGTSRFSGSHGHVFGNGTQTMLSVSRYRGAGQSRIEFPEVGKTARNMDHDEAIKLLGSIARGPWRVQFSHSTRDKLIPTGAYGVAFDDPCSETTDARGFVNVAFERRLGGVTLMSRAAYDWYLYDGTYSYGTTEPLYYDASRGFWGSAETIVRRRQGAHLVSGGVEFRNHLRQDQTAHYEGTSPGSDLDARGQSQQWAVFAQDEFTISRNSS